MATFPVVIFRILSNAVILVVGYYGNERSNCAVGESLFQFVDFCIGSSTPEIPVVY